MMHRTLLGLCLSLAALPCAPLLAQEELVIPEALVTQDEVDLQEDPVAQADPIPQRLNTQRTATAQSAAVQPGKVQSITPQANTEHPLTQSTRTQPAPRNSRMARSARPAQEVSAEALIKQRAMYRARERLARTELRNWSGTSSQRPNVVPSTYFNDSQPHVYSVPWFVQPNHRAEVSNVW